MAELCALEGGWQKGIAPVGRTAESGDFVQQDISGQVLVE
ncbi:MAG: hypothetical protein RLZZ536_1085 [Planctomycetota bacterium]|jgi:hypothetical protein